MKKCIYCSMHIPSETVVDMCEGCMYRVWGKKMAEAIVSQMQTEKTKGNMELGRVSETSGIRHESRIEEIMEVSEELAEELEKIEENTEKPLMNIENPLENQIKEQAHDISEQERDLDNELIVL